jgi:RNA-binding protein
MKSKDRVGIVSHISKSSGNLILRAERDVKIGDIILDPKGKRIGNIFDVFGPLEAPFLAVKSKIKDPERLIGMSLFLGKKKSQ